MFLADMSVVIVKCIEIMSRVQSYIEELEFIVA